MSEVKQISFRPMINDDLVLMLICKYYTEKWADELYRVIIEYDRIPIGYAHIYSVQGEIFDEYNYHKTVEKIYATDQFIGEPEY